jgi:hypothetical protein
MPTLKIYPPEKLPATGVTDLTFDIWSQELTIYIQQDERLAVFLPRGAYHTWQPGDENPDRITEVQGGDAAAQLAVRRRELLAFLSIVAKSCHIQHYNVIMRHSTSLTWIFQRLREDYDIQQKGIHFFNLLDLKYTPGEPAAGFYNNYRNILIANLRKTGDTIAWQNNTVLEEDEKLSPTTEDLVLANVLALIDSRLPGHIKDHYHHLIGRTKSLMDYKADILVKIPTFLAELDKPHSGAVHCQPEEHLGSIRYQSSARGRNTMSRGSYGGYRGNNRQPAYGTPNNRQNKSLYCRLCHLTGQPEEMVRSHRLGDLTCPKISAADKQHIEASRAMPHVNAISQPPEDDDIANLADQFGYGELNDDGPQDDQVRMPIPLRNSLTASNPASARSGPQVNPAAASALSRPAAATRNLQVTAKAMATSSTPKCNLIKPVPSQILTVFTKDKTPVHIELDSNATLNYIRLDAAKALKVPIMPNSQLSILADGLTKLPAVGEIHHVFYRNEWEVTLQAVVVEQLHTQIIGGTVFLKKNSIQQDFINNTIKVGPKIVVPATSPAMLLPIQPYSQLCTIHARKTLLPEQSITVNVPFTDNDVIAVEPADSSAADAWPPPQLCTVTKGGVTLHNSSPNPILIGKDIKQITIRPTTLLPPKPKVADAPSRYLPTNQIADAPDLPALAPDLPAQVLSALQEVHNKYQQVFNKDLTKGYNGNSGPHTCHLNWAGDTRPTADQVRMVSYSHDLKQLHQTVCDDLTRQQVLGIPQEHDITVQFVCPSFLRRKPRAKGKPNHLLTKDDVRLVVNFSPINNHLKNIPSVKTTPNDILIALGRWKHIIIFDLYQGFFQNHMAHEDSKWLGVATPFGGIRFLRRSGQGLLGQSEELEELLSKILQDELHEGTCCKIADDIIIGGQTQQQTTQVYETVLKKLHAANIKLAASKTHIFPKTADILGWKWHQGGKLQPSPHRQLALKNTKQEDITTIKDLRSWVGLYKTLLIATPNLATIMDPFDQEAANKESKEKVTWSTHLANAFREAKNHIDTIKDLYLPSPDDQLLLVPDGSQKTPGIGHILYAIVDGCRKPVRYHSVKLPENVKKWSPCEVEALAFATGIQAEIDIIKESKHPLLIAPDSCPVKDAVNLIKKGKFSASARMNSFITNINRIPVEVLHVSGKANLNAGGDMHSRNPSTCNTELCTICTFVNTSIQSVLNPTATLGAISSRTLYNPKSWAAAQNSNAACKTAASHLRTGKQPSKKSGQICSEVRRYCSIATIDQNGCLVVHPPPELGKNNLKKIIIPTPLLPSLLWHMHNAENHPTKTQLRALFDTMFYGIMVQNQLDTLYEECFQCKVQAKLPKPEKNHSSCTQTNHPGEYMHADVIKRHQQKIFILRDQFSSLTSTTLINSEQAADLKSAIINLTSPIRLAPQITVRTDNATGFQALTKDKDLQNLGITIALADSNNINSNAVVDKACSEIETEITKLQPQSGKITETTLAQATLLLNTKIRRKEQLSATEIHFSRSQTTSENLHLDDQQLRTSQIGARHLSVQTPQTTLKQGDSVVLKEKPNKHASRDVFLVTDTNNQEVHMQKIANPLSSTPNIRPKVYVTQQKLLHPVHKPTILKHTKIKETIQLTSHHTPEQEWSPFNRHFYTQHEDQEEDDELPQQQELPAQQMDNWLQQHRQRARQALQQQQNAIQAYIPPPRPLPPPQQQQQQPIPNPRPQLTHQQREPSPGPPQQQQIQTPPPQPTSPQPIRPPRAAKQQAIQKMAEMTTKDTIPQLEGAEPTPETSPNTSTTNTTPNTSSGEEEQLIHHLSPTEPWSPTPPHDENHELNLAFLLQDYHESSPSPEWDDTWPEPYGTSDSEYEHDDLLFESPHPDDYHYLPRRRNTN